MTTKIVVLTTEGESREDGNVYYSRYLLVSSDTLAFDEDVFTLETISNGDIEGVEHTDDEDTFFASLITHIQGLGYTVEEPEHHVLTASIY